MTRHTIVDVKWKVQTTILTSKRERVQELVTQLRDTTYVWEAMCPKKKK